MTQMAQAFLKMQGQRIVNIAGYTILSQMADERIPICRWDANHVLIEYVLAMGCNRWSLNEAFEMTGFDQAIVAQCRGLPVCRPTVEVWEFHPQNRRMNGVDTSVPADVFVVILRLHAVYAQRLHAH